jgi:hypothetical protein
MLPQPTPAGQFGCVALNGGPLFSRFGVSTRLAADARRRALLRRVALETLGEFGGLASGQHASDLVGREHLATAFVERMSGREFGADRDTAHGGAQPRGRERVALDDGDATRYATTARLSPPKRSERRRVGA